MLKKFSQKEQRFYKISIIALSLLVVVSLLPSAIPGFKEISPVKVVHADAVPYSVENIALNPGRNETELNFTWLSPGLPAASIVQMAKKADMTGGVFPDSAQTVTVTGTAVPATTVTDSVYYSNKATVTGLTPKTKYVYRVGDGNAANWSPAYDFTTQDPTNYTIMFVGDPQIGSSGSVVNDTYGWANTLKQAVSKFPNYSFIMSAGDQIENKSAAALETEYDGFQSPDILKSLPMASVVGNHDVNINYKYHFNVPNESNLGIKIDTRNQAVVADPTYGGDYYYTYGDTLFMVLDTNNTNGAEHVQFMQETVAKEPDTKWRIVTFHHDIYGGGQAHSTEQVVLNLRAALFPTLDALDVDMIFMGHDHSYVRTYVMNGDNVQGRQLVDSQGRDVNPNGNTYVTANSASGSKYYELNTTPERYSASRSQLHTPTFSTISVTPNSISVDTFRSDTLEKLDTYGLVKEPEQVKVYAKTAQQDTNSQLDYYYAINNANAVQKLDTSFKYDSAKINFVSAELVTTDAGTFDVDTASAGVVNIKADLTTPIRSAVYGQYQDVIKLTFETIDKLNAGKASVELTKSALTTQNKHAETVSNVEANTADVTVEVPTTPTPGTPTPGTPTPGTPTPGTPTPGTPTPGTPSTGGTTKQFNDIPSGYWAAAAINDLVSKQILNGTSDTTFEPQRSATRAEFTAMLVRALKLTEQSTVKFTDVKSGDWYADAVAAALKAGIVQGTSATLFGANEKITREAMVTMLMRGYEMLNGKVSVNGSITFKDEAKFSSWAAAYIKEAAALGLVGGREEGVFQPAGITTRGEAAQVIFNLLSK
ncbi:S-layer homology domain-containing protein [Paenibacillus solisilvae]|uniref:S-layer homology domain-containing protein n=1 Tax=Paenibacillus solisilvae TaxID=2486751 RepID=A0ABW0W2E7_9BACL